MRGAHQIYIRSDSESGQLFRNLNVLPIAHTIRSMKTPKTLVPTRHPSVLDGLVWSWAFTRFQQRSFCKYMQDPAFLFDLTHVFLQLLKGLVGKVGCGWLSPTVGIIPSAFCPLSPRKLLYLTSQHGNVMSSICILPSLNTQAALALEQSAKRRCSNPAKVILQSQTESKV